MAESTVNGFRRAISASFCVLVVLEWVYGGSESVKTVEDIFEGGRWAK